MNPIESIVSDWPGIDVGPHRFNAREFTLDSREIGHLHGGRLLDIPFPKRVRDILVEEERAETHHIYPDSGWVSYRVRSDEDIDGALWLLRVSYLYSLTAMRKRDGDHPEVAVVDIDATLTELDLSDELRRVFNEERAAG